MCRAEHETAEATLGSFQHPTCSTEQTTACIHLANMTLMQLHSNFTQH